MKTRVALDANLLLLFIVGSVDRDSISPHKRLRQYDPRAFDLLIEFISGASKVLTTPNVLTEISNVLDWGVTEPRRSALKIGFSQFIASVAVEIYHPSSSAAADAEFMRLGLADCAWLGCVDAETILLTDDLPLFNVAISRGLTAYNFTHLRVSAGLLPS